MDRCRFLVACLLLIPEVLLLAADGHVPRPEAGAAPLLDHLGDFHHPISTKSKQAQRYFDQGMVLTYGFNHPEAIRSFQEAARLDPDCAMAHWGVALAYGPNINLPMPDDAVPLAYAALQKALVLTPKASEREQAYIRALAKRYGEKPVKDRSDLDRAYADAMRELVKRYPDDHDARTLFAEALMNTSPWNYWSEDGRPQPVTMEILDALETVLRRSPDHAGACHYYIHAVEASPHPERALGAAHRLRHLVPGAGHLVHMPAHIYVRVGNYHEAALCNERAIAVDEAYIARYKVTGTYPMMYYAHNVHFLWYAAAMEGRADDSIRAARKLASVLSKADLEHQPEMRAQVVVPYLALARFGRWDEVLRETQPDKTARFETAIWHYARGLAFTRQRSLKDAQAELTSLDRILSRNALQSLETPMFPASAVGRLAQLVLTAEVASLKGDRDEQIRRLEEAVRQQDQLPYMEPPHWYFPVRQSLGAALVQAGQWDKAEKIYREDLKRHPENGWSLFGLLQCQRARGQTAEAAETERRFREAWKHADTTLTASGF